MSQGRVKISDSDNEWEAVSPANVRKDSLVDWDAITPRGTPQKTLINWSAITPQNTLVDWDAITPREISENSPADWDAVSPSDARRSSEVAEEKFPTASVFEAPRVVQTYFLSDYKIRELLKDSTKEIYLAQQAAKEAKERPAKIEPKKPLEISSIHISGTRLIIMPRLPQGFFKALEKKMANCVSACNPLMRCLGL